jgi:two-component system chemotaxis response regulator CheB
MSSSSAVPRAGVEALIKLVGTLPADLPACVLVTVHIAQDASSRLPKILCREGPLAAVHPDDGEPLAAGRIYVAPPGRHLLMTGGRVELSEGPRINRHRPAVDAMFGSAARWAGDRVVAIVLSELLDDGAVGAALIAQSGGKVIVQDPAEAAFPSMPSAALRAAPGASAAASGELGRVAAAMLGEQGLQRWPHQTDRLTEPGMQESSDPQYLAENEDRPTRMACPECGGVLAELRLPQISYYRCDVGHQFAPQTLAAAQYESAEAKLWSAIAALEENAAFARHLAEHDSAGDGTADEHAHAAERAARLAESVSTQLRSRSHRPR